MDFNNLPFACELQASTHRLSEKFVEFYEEPKLKLHQYAERNKPYMSHWFAITSEWFPDNKYLVFDERLLIDTTKQKLSYDGEKALMQLAGLIVQQFDGLLDFIKSIAECSGEKGEEKRSLLTKEVTPMPSNDKWDSLQPLSQTLLSMWYQSDSKEVFLSISGDINEGEVNLQILNECLTYVRESEIEIFNSFCKQKVQND